MPKKLDIDKVNSALKRAAQAAVSGRRDDRAGRFVGRDSSSGKLADTKPDKHPKGDARDK
jgi:hypothetical protein